MAVLEGEEVREEGVARQRLREVALRSAELGAAGAAVDLLEVAPQRARVVARLLERVEGDGVRQELCRVVVVGGGMDVGG